MNSGTLVIRKKRSEMTSRDVDEFWRLGDIYEIDFYGGKQDGN